MFLFPTCTNWFQNNRCWSHLPKAIHSLHIYLHFREQSEVSAADDISVDSWWQFISVVLVQIPEMMKSSWCGKLSCATTWCFLANGYTGSRVFTISQCEGCTWWAGGSLAAQGPSCRSGCQRCWGLSDSWGFVVLLVDLRIIKKSNVKRVIYNRAVKEDSLPARTHKHTPTAELLWDYIDLWWNKANAAASVHFV